MQASRQGHDFLHVQRLFSTQGIVRRLPLAAADTPDAGALATSWFLVATDILTNQTYLLYLTSFVCRSPLIMATKRRRQTFTESSTGPFI